MKSDFGIFTIVQNEKYFLPKLIKYYTQYVDEKHFYILDHDSNDGSTDNLNVNIVKIFNKRSFDHAWLVQVVENFQQTMLSRYKNVIFVEADDFLYTLNGDFIQVLSDHLKENDYAINTGYNIVHDYLNTEKDTDLTLEQFDCSIKYRNYWTRKPNHDKALVTKVPLFYTHGFHGFRKKTKGINGSKCEDLFLAHLHTVDFNLNIERGKHRLENRDTKGGDGEGHHNKTASVNQQIDYFKRFIPKMQTIPIEHKERMISLGI